MKRPLPPGEEVVIAGWPRSRRGNPRFGGIVPWLLPDLPGWSMVSLGRGRNVSTQQHDAEPQSNAMRDEKGGTTERCA